MCRCTCRHGDDKIKRKNLMVLNSVLLGEFPVCVTVRKKSSNDFVLRVLFSMCHQLRTEVADGEEVVRPFN